MNIDNNQIAAIVRQNANNLHDLLNVTAGIILDENVRAVVEKSTNRNVENAFHKAGGSQMNLVALADEMETRQ